jgi:hypothetical protein
MVKKALKAAELAIVGEVGDLVAPPTKRHNLTERPELDQGNLV